LELILLILPFYIVWNLKMNLRDKFIVLYLFSLRLPVIPFGIMRLQRLFATSRSTDYTFDIVSTLVFSQVEMHWCLIAASIPCIRPLFRSWSTGNVAAHDILGNLEPRSPMTGLGRSSMSMKDRQSASWSPDRKSELWSSSLMSPSLPGTPISPKSRRQPEIRDRDPDGPYLIYGPGNRLMITKSIDFDIHYTDMADPSVGRSTIGVAR
jgi:hypothetical protein